MLSIKKFVVCLFCGLVLTAGAGMGQNALSEDVYTEWLNLSIRGLSQEEIEARLNQVDPQLLDNTKSRLRRVILANLRGKNVGNYLKNVSNPGDFKSILFLIKTELRFFGMHNDKLVKIMIKDEFKIPLNYL